MQSPEEQNPPVNAKAALVDPESMTVLWMNESAAQEYAEGGRDFAPGTPVTEAVPMAELLGVPLALREVAHTGVAQHLRTGLVSTAKGSLAIATSVYRLPDGKLLLLTEHAWQAATGGSGPRRRKGPGPGHGNTERQA